MAKRHGGLGRGLDALIPQSRPASESRAEQRAKERRIEEEEAARKKAEEKAREGKGQVLVRISQIEPNRDQPRRTFDEESLAELADSIGRYGLLQPILVREKEGHYEIIAGERRWRACMQAGLKEVPVIIRTDSEQTVMELALIENLQREDLNPMEEARAYRRLMEEFSLTQEQIGERVSKSRPVIANALRLLNLEEEVQQMVEEGKLSAGHARCLSGLKEPEDQVRTARKILEENLSVRETEALIASLGGKAKKKPAGKKKDPAMERIYRDLEKKMKAALGTKVSIRPKGKKGGKLEIEFYSSEDLEKIIDRMTGPLEGES